MARVRAAQGGPDAREEREENREEYRQEAAAGEPSEYAGVRHPSAKGGQWTPAMELGDRAFGKPRNYFICTNRPDGRPHAAAVWGILLDDTFLFSTATGSTKARNIARNPNCVVCPEPAAGIDRAADETLVAEGVAKRFTNRATLQRFAKVYEQKYDWEADPQAGNYFVVRPRVVFAFGAKDDFVGSATRWTFPRR